MGGTILGKSRLGPLGASKGGHCGRQSDPGPLWEQKWSKNGAEWYQHDPKIAPKMSQKDENTSKMASKMEPKTHQEQTKKKHTHNKTHKRRKTIRPGGMREAIRRPTGDGVLDPPRNFHGPGSRISGNFWILVPLHNPPQAPRAFRPADPLVLVSAPFLASKNASEFSLDF